MPPLQAELIDDPSALAGLAEAWDGLAVALSRPYATPAWGLSWWRHLRAPEDELRAIAIRSGGELVGIAPMYATAQRGGYAEYRVLGAERAPRLMPLAKPGMEDQVATAVASALSGCTPRPALIGFVNMPTDSPWQSLLADSWPAAGAWAIRRYTMPAPQVTLGDGGFEQWLRGRSSNFRQQMKRSRKKLDQDGVSIRLSGSVGKAHEDLESFAALHLERWNRRGGSAVINPGVVSMLHDVAADLVPRGRFQILNMDAGGKTICSLVFLEAGEELGWWLGGWDEAWADRRPGLIGLLLGIERAFQRGGIRRLDLGGGSQPYKYRLADREDLFTRTSIVAPGIGPVLRRPGIVGDLLAEEASRRFSWKTKDRARAIAGRLRRGHGE